MYRKRELVAEDGVGDKKARKGRVIEKKKEAERGRE